MNTTQSAQKSKFRVLILVVGIVLVILAVLAGLAIRFYATYSDDDDTYSVRLCASDSHSNEPHCTYKRVRIMRGTENDFNLCGQGKYGEAVYDVVGGFVGIEYVGCAPPER